MHWLCDRWAFVRKLRLTTNMTSSVTRRVVRTGGSCLLKRIVVLGDEPSVVLLLLLLLFAPGRLRLASDSNLWMVHKANNCVFSVEFKIETSQAPSRTLSLFISNRKVPSIARWMRTLCAELKPLSRPYRHCFVRLLANYRLQLAKLLLNSRYVLCFLCFSQFSAVYNTKAHNASAKCVFNVAKRVWFNKRCFKELLFCLTPFAPFRGWLARSAS